MSARPIEIAARLGEYERDHAIVAMWHRGAKRRDICRSLHLSSVIVNTVLAAWLETEDGVAHERALRMDARNAAIIAEYESGAPLDEICRRYDIEHRLALNILASKGIAA